MYYALSSAYQSKIDPERFFETADAARIYDILQLKTLFGTKTYEALTSGETTNRTVRAFQFAVDLWADAVVVQKEAAE